MTYKETANEYLDSICKIAVEIVDDACVAKWNLKSSDLSKRQFREIEKIYKRLCEATEYLDVEKSLNEIIRYGEQDWWEDE